MSTRADIIDHRSHDCGAKEHPLPSEDLHEETPDCRPDHASRPNYTHLKAEGLPSLFGWEACDDHCHRSPLRHSGAHALHDSYDDQGGHIGRETSSARGHYEDNETYQVDSLTARNVRQSAHGQEQRADSERISDQYPLRGW